MKSLIALEAKDVVKKYGSVVALDNLSLKVKEGEVFGLLGPNGAGKTTFINCILGLTKLDRGEIFIFEKPLNRALTELKSQIGIVPQEISLYSSLTVYENLSFFGSLYNIPGKLLKERIEFALEFVQMQDNVKKPVKNLSGGMKRRVNIAAALIHSPKLLIMDEPTVGIDIYSRKIILDSVQKLAQTGITIIYTTHYIEEVDKICSSVAFINKGKIIEYGPKELLYKKLSDTHIVKIQTNRISNECITTLRNTEGILNVNYFENELTVTVEKSKNLLKEIIDILDEHSCEIFSILSEKPSMEKLYFSLMGYTIDEKGEIVCENGN